MIFPSNNNSTWATYCTAVMVFNSQIAWKGGNPINNYHGFSCKKELFYVCKLLLNGSIQCYQLCLMPIAYLMVQNWFGFQSFQIRMRCNADFKNVHSFVSCNQIFPKKNVSNTLYTSWQHWSSLESGAAQEIASEGKSFPLCLFKFSPSSFLLLKCDYLTKWDLI